VNLGPPDAILPYIPPNPQSNGLGYNPRCIIRDVSSYVSSHWTKDSDIYDLIVGYKDIGSFQSRLQGDFNNGYLGIHSGGHYTDGGDPGGDFFASPGDPYFFLHRE
jgi:tyrosinase